MTTRTDSRAFIADMLAADDPDLTPTAPSGVTLDFTIKKFIFQLLLEKAYNVVPTRDAMPVLKNFQIEATTNGLRVVATDMELSMIVPTSVVSVAAPGVAVFPARRLLDTVRCARDGDAHIIVAGPYATIAIGGTTWRFKLATGSDFPVMPEIGEVTFATVDRVQFLTALQHVRYAAPKDSERLSLSLIDIRNGRMHACDGARFQQAKVAELPFELQIPTGALDQLLKLLSTCDLPTIKIGDAADQNKLIFALGADVFIVNKLMVKFHDQESAFLRPALDNKLELTVDRGDLLDAIKRVRIAADPHTSAIALTLKYDKDTEQGTLTITARDGDRNYCTETIDAGWTHPERTIAVNHGFLTDMIRMHSGQILHFYLGTDTLISKSPVLLRDPDTGTLGVVQQMRLDWVIA